MGLVDEKHGTLAERARAGVQVFAIHDWFGGLGVGGSKLWRPLEQAGGLVRRFNPPRLDSPFGWLTRDHRKLVAVDGEVGFVSGLCVSRKWVGDPTRGIEPWRDTGIEVRGPAVADLEEAFAQVWAATGSPLDRSHLTPAASIPIATTARLWPQTIALSEVGRQAIYRDPNWRNGNYYDGKPPDAGLALARMIGHITYLSDESMHQKFGRRLRHREKYGYDFSTEFEVESYLQYHGENFPKRFDANSYLYITKAMDYFDLSAGHASLSAALEHTRARFLVMSFTSDWLYPTYQSVETVSALRSRRRVRFRQARPSGRNEDPSGTRNEE